MLGESFETQRYAEVYAKVYEETLPLSPSALTLALLYIKNSKI